MDTICTARKRAGSNAAWMAGANVIDGHYSTGAWTQARLQEKQEMSAVTSDMPGKRQRTLSGE